MDLRAAPADLTVPLGPASRAPGVRVVHSVGSDTVIGKKVVTLELDRVARERGLRSVYVPTGQTGVAIAGWGLAVDHVISDYVAGAAERLVHEGSEHGDLLFVEGQGALFHPAYSGVTLGLLHGSAPDVLVLVHKAGATSVRNYPDLPLVPLPELVAAYESVTAPVRPARVAAIALNTSALDDDAARAAVEQAERDTGLVTDDVVRFGPERVLDAVLAALPTPREERSPSGDRASTGPRPSTSCRAEWHDLWPSGPSLFARSERGLGHANASPTPLRAGADERHGALGHRPGQGAAVRAGPRGRHAPLGARRGSPRAPGADRGGRAPPRRPPPVDMVRCSSPRRRAGCAPP